MLNKSVKRIVHLSVFIGYLIAIYLGKDARQNFQLMVVLPVAFILLRSSSPLKLKFVIMEILLFTVPFSPLIVFYLQSKEIISPEFDTLSIVFLIVVIEILLAIIYRTELKNEQFKQK